jgi:peptidoglycan-associated lipoprotein
MSVVYFAFDSSLLDDQTQAQLRKAAEWLNRAENRTVRFRIEGHCDERGTEEYNIGLGDRRAHATKEFLMGLGISDDRIETLSFGETRPAESGHSEEQWSKNRRAEFVYLGGGEQGLPRS